MHKALPVLSVLRVLRLVRMFKLIKLYKRPFDLIIATFADSFTTLNTIVFLILLSGIIISMLMFAIEAAALDPLTHVRTAAVAWQLAGRALCHEPCRCLPALQLSGAPDYPVCLGEPAWTPHCACAAHLPSSTTSWCSAAVHVAGGLALQSDAASDA